MQDASELGRRWLAEHGGHWGYLSRRDRSRGAPELARHLRGDLLAKQSRDGSWGEGDLLASANAVWRLLDLDTPPASEPLARALDWMYERQDAPGAFGTGCTPARHESELCEHFVGGFFSPAPDDEPQEACLSNGQSVNSDTGARLLISERVLRTVLRANPSDPRARVSIQGLASLPLYAEYGGAFTPALLVGALQALAWVPGGPPSVLVRGLETLAAAQRKTDRSWRNVEDFFALEALLEIDHFTARRLLVSVVPRLLKGQYKNGSWGRRFQATQTWIAVQVIEMALDGILKARGASLAGL